MQYRQFGKTKEKVSVLGFGCMRLPLIEDATDNSQIDETKAIALIRCAIDKGVNYIDTAYPYHGTSMGEGGASEPLVGRALQAGYREKVFLATKSPCWLVQKPEDFDRLLEEQLARLQTDHIDFYLMHALDENYWSILQQNNYATFLDRALKSGKIRHAGFSFHGPLTLFKTIVDSYDWSFCQIQYNYLDENFQAGTEGLDYAAQKGLGVVIMEPLRGGKLAVNLPDDVLMAFQESGFSYTPAQWALRWVWNHPQVSLLLSGMNAQEQLDENVATAETAVPNDMTAAELSAIASVRQCINAKSKISCTACSYCQPCPNQVAIPRIFAAYNSHFMFGDNQYSSMNDDIKGHNCIGCGLCESHCPQNIDIRRQLKIIDEFFAKK